MYRFEDKETLTNRECDVVYLVAKGLSAKEAALYLNIAPCTIERRVENVRLKMRTRNVMPEGLMEHYQPHGWLCRGRAAQ